MRGNRTELAYDEFRPEELVLAGRNHSMPLEALRYDVTPAGLHYLLIHFDIPAANPDTHLLSVGGAVGQSVQLSLDDLHRLPQRDETVLLECAGNGRSRISPRPVSVPWGFEAIGNATWSGPSVRDVIEMAEPDARAIDAVFTGADRGEEGGEEQNYQRALTMEELSRPEVILATRMNGEPLLPQHGFPLRLIVPGWYGMTSVKWLTSIELITEPFRGYQHEVSYRFRENENDHGRPVGRILPRSLVQPPGIPEQLTRRRIVPSGQVSLSGRAWSGHGRVTSVQVTTDAGKTWNAAALRASTGEYGWLRWEYNWNASPGEFRIGSRASDSSGRSQPTDPVWNLDGFEINSIQWIEVEVRD